MKKRKQMVALFVAASMCVGIVSSSSAQAAPKIKLSTKSMTLKVGQTRKLLVKKSKKAAKWSVVSGKKVIQLKNKKKNSVKIVGVKKGTAKVQAKIGKTKYFCKVKVKETKNKQPQNTPAPVVTNQPVVSSAPVVNNPSVIATSNPNVSAKEKYWDKYITFSMVTTEGENCYRRGSSDHLVYECSQGETVKDRIPDLYKRKFYVYPDAGEPSETVISNVIWHDEPYRSDGSDGGYYSFELHFIWKGISYYRTCTLSATYSSNPAPTQAPGSIINKLPENINEEDLQEAKKWDYYFRLRDNTEFGVSHWEQPNNNTIEIELEDGMQSLKEAVPDPAACIKEIAFSSMNTAEVLVRDVSSSVESTSNGTDGLYYNFKLYFYSNETWYCENMVMRAVSHKEEVQGTIFVGGKKLSETEFGYLGFVSKDNSGRCYYSSQYDGETFAIRVPAGTYDVGVSVQMAGYDNFIPTGTVTVEKGVVNNLSLRMIITGVSGKVTQNGAKPEQSCTIYFINKEAGDSIISYQTDADGNYKTMLPEGDYKVEVQVGMGKAYCGELQVSGTESEINKDFDVEVKNLTFDQQQNFTMTKDGKSTLFKFTPTETAVYEWSMLGNGKDGKYDWCIGYKGFSGSSGHLYADDKDKWSCITDQVLIEGVTYWMSIEGSELASDMSVALKLTKSDETEIINLDQSKTWDQTSSGVNTYYYAFTAPEDGTYRFSGTASQKETLEDWNSVRCQLYGIDVKESDIYNFDAETKKGTLQKDVELKKGNVVIAEVYVNAYTMSGDFTITKVQ